MKTKFIKVNTADRLPEEDGEYYTELGLLNYNEETELFYNLRGKIRLADECFLEVPDREEEMREMLEELNKTFKSCVGYGHPVTERVDKLLNELKQ